MEDSFIKSRNNQDPTENQNNKENVSKSPNKLPGFKIKYKNPQEIKKISIKLKHSLLSEKHILNINNNKVISPIKSNQKHLSINSGFSCKLKSKSNLLSDYLPPLRTSEVRVSIKSKLNSQENFNKKIENKQKIFDSPIQKEEKEIDDLLTNLPQSKDNTPQKVEIVQQKGFTMLNNEQDHDNMNSTSFDKTNNNDNNNNNNNKYNYSNISISNPINFSVENQLQNNYYRKHQVKNKKSMMLLSPKKLKRVLLKNNFSDNQDKSLLDSKDSKNNTINSPIKNNKKMRKRSITLPNLTLLHMSCSIFEANSADENDDSLIEINDSNPGFLEKTINTDKYFNNDNEKPIFDQIKNQSGILKKNKKYKLKRDSHVMFCVSDANPHGKVTTRLNEFIGKNKLDFGGPSQFIFTNNNKDTDRNSLKIHEEKEIKDFDESSINFSDSYLSKIVSNNQKNINMINEGPHFTFHSKPSKQLPINSNINLASRKSPSCVCLIF